MNSNKKDISTNIFNISVFSSQKKELLSLLKHHFNNSTKIAYIFTPNPEQVVQSHCNTQQGKQFLADLQSADYLIPDGIGLVWASQFLYIIGALSQPISQRITGADFVLDLISLAKESLLACKVKVMIVGGKGYSQQGLKRFSNLHNCEVCWIEGYTDVTTQMSQTCETSQTYQTPQTQKILQRIAVYRPHLVFVALGAPYQERWIVENATELQKNGVRIAMAVGGSFDYLLGLVPRAPKSIQNMGLEWLFRLVYQPWRWKRQLKLLSFCRLVLWQSIRKKDT